MWSPRSSFRRRVLSVLPALGLLLALPCAAADEALPPLRLQKLAVGTRCFGFLPCTQIDPFGLRLRAAVLAVFRPEKGHDRDFYAARIQIAPSVTLFEWAEIGVAIPFTLYKNAVGVTSIYEPLEPFGRVRSPLEKPLGGVATTVFVRLHIASGPFAGGLPPLPESETGAPSPSPDLVQQGIEAYRQKTQFEGGLALTKRIGPVTFTGAFGTSISVDGDRVEVEGGGEIAYHFKLLHVFLQMQGLGVPKCPPAEAKLKFCDSTFRFAAGARFDWDLGQGGLLISTGSGAAEPGWSVGAQLGLDYDETTRHRHGDGIEAAERRWERLFARLRQGWAEWQAAAVMWPPEQVPQHIGPRPAGPFSGLVSGAPPPQSSWLDALLDHSADQLQSVSINPDTPQAVAGPSGVPSAKALAKRQLGKRPGVRHPFGPIRQAIAAAQRVQIPEQLPTFQIQGGDPDWLKAEQLDHVLRAAKEQLREAEQQQWRDSPQVPPIEKPILNWLATAPARAVLGLLAMSGPGRRAEAEEQMRKLRPLKCTPAEEEACGAIEEMLDLTATVLAPSAAEAAVARQGMLALARQGAREAGHAAEFAAAERAALGTAAEECATSLEQNGPRFASLLDRLPPRLNPLNYECCGLGSNFGNMRFKPSSSRTAAGANEAIEAIAEHGFPGITPARVLQTGGNKIKATTAQELNEALGKNLSPREWGRALEELKAAEDLRHNFHGRILSNGEYVDPHTGESLGNLLEYLP